jgi:hypothetical protein
VRHEIGNSFFLGAKRGREAGVRSRT